MAGKRSNVTSGYSRDFGTAFQLHALAVICRTPGAAVKHRPVLDAEYFEAQVANVVADSLLKHVDKYRVTPSKGTLLTDIREALTAPVWEKQGEAVERFVRKLWKQDISDHQAVVDKLSRFGLQRAVENAVVECAGDIAKGKVEGIVERIKKATLVGQNLEDDMIQYNTATPTERERWYDEASDIVPTGLSILDKVMGGGLRRQALYALMGGAKSGKTTGVINMGFGAAVRGFNVLHLSCELAKHYVARRYDARIAEVKVKYLRRNPEKYRAIVQSRVDRLIAGSLSIASFPTRTLTGSAIRRILDRRKSEGVGTDLLIVDYADIMRPELRITDKKHDQIAGIYEDLRGIAGEYNATVLTPSQVKQAAYNKETVDLSDFAEAFEKAAIIDGGFAICQTPDEAAKNECRIVHVADRSCGAGSVVRCHIRRGECLIQDVELLDPDVALASSRDNRRNRRGGKFGRNVPQDGD